MERVWDHVTPSQYRNVYVPCHNVLIYMHTTNPNVDVDGPEPSGRYSRVASRVWVV